MSDPIMPEDFADTEALLDELYETVSEADGYLGGGTKLPVSVEMVQSLRETRIKFGNPLANLIRLTPELFAEVGAELNSVRKQQMAERYDFYYMTVPVSLQPGPAAQFSRLSCGLDFGPQGAGEPIVQALFPEARWHEVLRWGGGMSLALDGNLGWNAGIETPTSLAGLNLPADLQANIGNKNELKAFVTVSDYSFAIGRAEISASGEGGGSCKWELTNPELKQASDLHFGTVFMVPRGAPMVELEGIVVADPSIQWLAGGLRHVFDELSERLMAFFRGERRLPIGDREQWKITLPQ